MKNQTGFLALIALLAASSAAHAEVYKWLDKDGKVQYTDTPPPASQSKTLAKTLKVPAPGPVTNTTPAVKDPLKDAVRAKADKEVKEQKAAEAEVAAQNAKINAENCREGKSYLATLDSGAPIRKANDAGEREILTEAQRAAERTRGEGVVAQSCK